MTIFSEAWREAELALYCADSDYADLYDETCDVINEWAAMELLNTKSYEKLLDYNWRYDSYWVTTPERIKLGG